MTGAERAVRHYRIEGCDYLPDPRVLRLGGSFYDEVSAAKLGGLVPRFRNDRWAAAIGLGGLDDDTWVDHFARFAPLPANLEQPLALRYHGHQFGVYNPDIGDGRGFLFAQVREGGLPGGRLLDLGTKGSGKTPWSRAGDGKLTLQGGVREVLATEMLEALGVSTSKSLSLVETGDRLFRGDEPSPTRASVLVRLSHSHIRFGTFQRFAHQGDAASLRRLVDHAVETHMPELEGAADRPLALFREVVVRTARLAASFQVAGFVHGVLNTDNMCLTGEAFDFGPWRFLEAWDPTFVAAYFDHTGLYAFGRQPDVFRWNLGKLADALRTVAPSSPLGSAVDGFFPVYAQARGEAMVRRLGLVSDGVDLDGALADAVVAFLAATRAPLSAFFVDWRGGVLAERRALASERGRLYEGPEALAFRRILESFAPACIPALDAPHADDVPDLCIGSVRAIWAAIAERDDWEPFHRMVARIRRLGARCTETSAPTR